jgi:hypothetical protein
MLQVLMDLTRPYQLRCCWRTLIQREADATGCLAVNLAKEVRMLDFEVVVSLVVKVIPRCVALPPPIRAIRSRDTLFTLLHFLSRDRMTTPLFLNI